MDDILESKFIEYLEDYISSVDLEINSIRKEYGVISDNEPITNSYKALLFKKIYAKYILKYFFDIKNDRNTNLFVGYKFLVNHLLNSNQFDKFEIDAIIKYFSVTNNFKFNEKNNYVGPSVLLVDFNRLLDINVKTLEKMACNFHEENLLASNRGKNRYAKFIDHDKYVDVINKIGLFFENSNTYNFVKYLETLKILKISDSYIERVREEYIKKHLKKDCNPFVFYTENSDIFDVFCVDDKAIIKDLIKDVMSRIYICSEDEYIQYKLLINEYLNLIAQDSIDLNKISRLN